jgi:uncharacterized protein YigE (DUF2233 family)
MQVKARIINVSWDTQAVQLSTALLARRVARRAVQPRLSTHLGTGADKVGRSTDTATKVASVRIHRMTKAIILLIAISWASLMLTHSPAMAEGPCKHVSHERSAYTVCEVDIRKHTIRLYWRRPEGAPYAYLRALPQSLDAKAGKLLFATNAGMFDPTFRPVGLYVEQGRELVRANTKSGYGNFHMKPNGVFYVTGDTAGVLETGAYLKLRPATNVATQSGPMLVINGRLHPKFDRASSSLKARNGVGIRTANTIVFAISLGEVSFDAFGRLFRDKLKCNNALFLDGGSASSLYEATLNRGGNLLPLGPMLGIFERIGTIRLQ